MSRVCVCVCVGARVCGVCAGERSHVIERHLNARTGERAKNQEFVNLEEGIYIIHRQSPPTSLFFTDRDALSHNTSCMYLYLIAGNLRRLNLGKLIKKYIHM